MFERMNREQRLMAFLTPIVAIVGATLITAVLYPHPGAARSLTASTLHDGMSGLRTTLVYVRNNQCLATSSRQVVFIHGPGTRGVTADVYRDEAFVFYNDTMKFQHGDTICFRVTTSAVSYALLDGLWRRQP